jgi:hypothetical protein
MTPAASRLGVRLCVLYTVARAVEWVGGRMYAYRCRTAR